MGKKKSKSKQAKADVNAENSARLSTDTSVETNNVSALSTKIQEVDEMPVGAQVTANPSDNHDTKQQLQPDPPSEESELLTENIETSKKQDPQEKAEEPVKSNDQDVINPGLDNKETASIENNDAVIQKLREQLEAVELERDEIQDEYDTLLEKVGTIKQRLGERFKELEAQSDEARSETAKITQKHLDLLEEMSVVKAERDAERSAKSQIENDSEKLKQQLISQKIMFDQEISNEVTNREALEMQVEQLKAELHSKSRHITQIEQFSKHHEEQAEFARKEIRLTQESEKAASLELLKVKKRLAETEAELAQKKSEAENLVSTSALALEKQSELQKDLKDSQVLIGKLRHEAVILNEHLTHALRIVRKDSEGTQVDRELVCNLFIQFATCPRQDTKKFEILMLISNFLAFDDEQRKLVGLEKNEFEEPPQMVGMVGKLAEFLERRKN